MAVTSSLDQVVSKQFGATPEAPCSPAKVRDAALSVSSFLVVSWPANAAFGGEEATVIHGTWIRPETQRNASIPTNADRLDTHSPAKVQETGRTIAPTASRTVRVVNFIKSAF